jgi:3-methyladenine DNA glycosylase AlkD
VTAEELAANVRQQLESAADADFARGVRNFFKEPVDPWGVRSVDVQRISRYTYGEVKQWPLPQRNKFCDILWRGRFEEGVLVCHVYRRFGSTCGRCEFKLFERWIDRYVENWAHADGVASWLLAACVANDPALKAELPAWTRSGNRWKRRASIVALLQEAKKGRNSEQILDIATMLRTDPDDMVRKGVGWVLKEAYPKRPEEVFAFLKELEFPRLVVRYAAEKMSKQHRAALGFATR